MSSPLVGAQQLTRPGTPAFDYTSQSKKTIETQASVILNQNSQFHTIPEEEYADYSVTTNTDQDGSISKLEKTEMFPASQKNLLVKARMSMISEVQDHKDLHFKSGKVDGNNSFTRFSQ